MMSFRKLLRCLVPVVAVSVIGFYSYAYLANRKIEQKIYELEKAAVALNQEIEQLDTTIDECHDKAFASFQQDYEALGAVVEEATQNMIRTINGYKTDDENTLLEF